METITNLAGSAAGAVASLGGTQIVLGLAGFTKAGVAAGSVAGIFKI